MMQRRTLTPRVPAPRSLGAGFRSLGVLLLLALIPTEWVTAQDTEDSAETESSVRGLEDYFPEKRPLGPGARSMEFSPDGAHAAYLYRPRNERRHGSDLWILEASSGEVRRLTSVSVLAPFQASTRKVRDDRIKKAKAEDAKSDATASDASTDEEGEEKEEGSANADSGSGSEDSDEDQDHVHLEDADRVGEDDAEDDDAPRYRGVSSFEWSPLGDELMFSSQGDLYRMKLDGSAPVRLTMTRDSESSVRYLPDASGYTYRRGSSVYRVRFGEDRIEELSPALEGGFSLDDYVLSPDGKALAIRATQGSTFPASDRRVNIASYRDRFMKVREVPRLVSDDPIPPAKTRLYLYSLPDALDEGGRLVRVHEHTITGPRDVLRSMDWAPDSSRLCFAVFSQSTSTWTLHEATLEDGDDDGAEDADPKDDASEDADEETDSDTQEAQGDQPTDPGTPSPRSSDLDGEHEGGTRVLKEILHRGGPNTPRMMTCQYLADSRRIVYLSEESGFRHLHILDSLYETSEPLTRGHGEVYPMKMGTDRTQLFATTTLLDPSCHDVIHIDVESGEMSTLTRGEAVWESVAVSPDGQFVLGTREAYGSLPELHLGMRFGEGDAGFKHRALTDSHAEEASIYTERSPEFFDFENRHGHRIHGLMFKPADLEEGETRPLLVYVYGGPLGVSKQVLEGSYSGSTYGFARYMCEAHGYITCTIDPRGMSGYGALFEKANFEQVGVPQTEDLVDGVRHLVAEHQVDPERVGIHGWSFGGFQTQMCLYTAPETFQVGIAGAGPTEWENYNAWYSTGTIGESRTGQTDLEKYSLLPKAKNLEGQLLLIHGMEDSNVLYQDTVRVYMALLEAGKESLVELFLDPTGGHGLGGHVKTLNRYRKYESFLLRTLGSASESEAGTESDPSDQ